MGNRQRTTLKTLAAVAFTAAASTSASASMTDIYEQDANITNIVRSEAISDMATNRGINNAVMEVAQCMTSTDKSIEKLAGQAIAKKALSTAFNNGSIGAGMLVNFIGAKRGIRQDLLQTAILLKAEGSPYADVFTIPKKNGEDTIVAAIYSPHNGREAKGDRPEIKADPNNVIVIASTPMGKKKKQKFAQKLLDGIKTSPERSMSRLVQRHGCN